jgi:hypothetical protein
MRRYAAICAVLLLAIGAAAYLLRGERAEPLATLSERHGTAVDRDHAAHQGSYAPATVGDRFEEGDGLRTGKDSTAEVRTRDGASVRVGSESSVRFTASADTLPQSLGIDLGMGDATIRASSHPVRLHTHVGLAVLDEASEVVLRRHADALELDVQLGTLRFTDSSGEMHIANGGGPLEVGIGMAVIERAPPSDATVPVEVIGEGVVQRRGGEAPLALPPGRHQLARGSLLQLSGAGRVRVYRGSDSVLLDAPGSYRLDVQGRIVDAMSGALRVSAHQDDVRIAVPGGVIVARGGGEGTEAELKLSPEGGDVRVLSGSVETEFTSGPFATLHAGEALRWPPAASVEDPSPALDSLSYAHLRVRAGESFVLHAPSAPLTVGFRLPPNCADEAELELGGKRKVRGKGIVNVALGAGNLNYAVRCAGAVRARGRVTVLVDAGNRKLPSRAPVSDIDADGRAYTIYYQNQLPELRVHWPQAPAKGPFLIDVDGKRYESLDPTFVFKSGMLADGPHDLVWTCGKRKSRPAHVNIAYDNAAPTASLQEPEDRGFSLGDQVRVRGDALKGWKVELEDGTIERDVHERFSGERVTTATSPDIVVRLSHPHHGVHYYVRRSAESP